MGGAITYTGTSHGMVASTDFISLGTDVIFSSLPYSLHFPTPFTSLLFSLSPLSLRPTLFTSYSLQILDDNAQESDDHEGSSPGKENESCESIRTSQKTMNLARHEKRKCGAQVAQFPDPLGEERKGAICQRKQNRKECRYIASSRRQGDK